MKTTERHIFRAKKICGVWIQGYLTHMKWIPGEPWFIHYVEKQEPDNSEVDQDTVCAFVCTIPGTDVKLFENYLIKINDDVFRIVWSSKYCGYYAECFDKSLYDLSEVFGWGNVELIGNIFDNPELWEGGEQ